MLEILYRLCFFREADSFAFQLDYVLVTEGLLPWIKHGDIQPSIKGSDHCPVHVDLHEEIEVGGQKLNLREQIVGSDPPEQPPRIATKFWDEFSGKQTMLSSFFKKGSQIPIAQTPSATLSEASSASVVDLDPEIEELPPPSSQVTKTSSPPPEPDSQRSRPQKRKESPPYPASQSSQPSSSTSARPAKKQKAGTKSGQTKLLSFFATPSNESETRAKPSRPSSEVIELDLDDSPLTQTQSSAPSQSDDPELLGSDFELTRSLASSQISFSNRSASSSQSKSSGPTAASWSMIMAPLVAPFCTVHGEPTKEMTVNKPGPNKGKKFYVCSRFVTHKHSQLSDVDECSFLGDVGRLVQATTGARPRGLEKK